MGIEVVVCVDRGGSLFGLKWWSEGIEVVVRRERGGGLRG